jgi:hypothetical protein
MAIQIPLWLLGKDFTVVSITPQTVSNVGVLSDGTAVTLTRLKTSLSINIDPQKEAINDDASLWEHNVVLADSFSFSLEVLMTKVNGTSPNKLYDALAASDICKLIVTFGAGTSTRTHTLYGSRSGYSFSSAGRGSVRETLSFDSVDTGTGTDAPYRVTT